MHGLRNNTLSEVFSWFCGLMADVYPRQECHAIARVVFEHHLQLDYSGQILQGDKRLTESQIVLFYKAAQKLQKHIPVQYVTGVSYFGDLQLEVNPAVLIPRPETHQLVQWVVQEIKNSDRQNLNLWDIGTGSGAIVISLGRELPRINLYASDVSPEALEVARKNAARHHIPVHFFENDILKSPPPHLAFDCIVSNPPYVRELEKQQMQKNVLDHEPHQALFVPDHDPLLFYKAIAQKAKTTLVPGGMLFLEINEEMGGDCCRLLTETGFGQTCLKKDFHGKDRFVKGTL